VVPAADTVGVACRLDLPDGTSSIAADSEQLKQLFGNLALNAVQAMPTGGALTFAVRFEEGKGGPRRAVEIAVSDTGSGIPETDVPRVFEPFYTTRTKGTGLGLAICKQIVQAHGGTIRVARTGPGGTTILIALPVEGPPHV
jgi:signal transduction histidine kinase